MSLDVYLKGEVREVECCCPNCGKRHTTTEETVLFDRNITHNLSRMADMAGLTCVWFPEVFGFTTGRQLIGPLQMGLERLESVPEKFQELEPENHWGSYETMVKFVAALLAACRSNPDAKFEVSR